MSFLKKIRNLLFLFAFIAAGTAYFDYSRMQSGDYPIFCKESYIDKTKMDICRGLFYVTERTIKRDPQERLDLSQNLKYKFLNQVIEINLPYPKDEKEFILFVYPNYSCGSSYLYYEWDTKKIYFDCIGSIRIKYKNDSESKSLYDALNEYPSLIEDILMNLEYVGMASDGITEKYVTFNDSFATKKIVAYRCHASGVEDIYLTLNDSMAPDYCLEKTDTLNQPDENS